MTWQRTLEKGTGVEHLIYKYEYELYQARRRRKADKLNGAWSYDGRVYIRDILDGITEVKSEMDIDTAIFETDQKIAEDPDKYRAILLKRKSKDKSRISTDNSDGATVSMDDLY